MGCCVAVHALKYACCGPWLMSGDPSVHGDVCTMSPESRQKVVIDSKGRFCGKIVVSSTNMYGSVVVEACKMPGSSLGKLHGCELVVDLDLFSQSPLVQCQLAAVDVEKVVGGCC